MKQGWMVLSVMGVLALLLVVGQPVSAQPAPAKEAGKEMAKESPKEEAKESPKEEAKEGQKPAHEGMQKAMAERNEEMAKNLETMKTKVAAMNAAPDDPARIKAIMDVINTYMKQQEAMMQERQEMMKKRMSEHQGMEKPGMAKPEAGKAEMKPAPEEKK